MENGMVTKDNCAARKAILPRIASRTLLAAAMGAVLAMASTAALAANPNKDQAKRIYDRIAGVPASDATLNAMTGMDATQAALQYATKDPAFFNNTIRNMATPWTNRDQTVFA